MYLKQLDMLGFKSFANKTSVKFSNGLTAIVGPNGCGKTNVLDALRWVLGEQKVTLLRSAKMDEVIFNGTREVKPLGMSEVSLTIVNNRGVLPTEYNELQITRRLFRSGESEYLMNKIPCRRKDIMELFWDTGVGAHSYSVIQQDMIDAILSDKPEERRFLFEEASGITKYKQRKEAALRKLDATETDFIRLKDIYAEVKTRVNSLYRQHKKAERYQKLTDAIKDWELYLASLRLAGIETEKRELRAELDKLGDLRLSRETSIDEISAQLETDRREQMELEQQLNSVGGEIYEITEKAHQLEKEISIYKEKRSNAVILIEKNEKEIETLKGRHENLKQQLKETEDELGVQQKVHDELVEKNQQARDVQAETDQRLLQARASRENEHQRLLELEGKLSSGKTEEHNLREQEHELTSHLSEIDAQLTELKPKQNELLKSLEENQESQDNRQNRKVELENSQQQMTEQLAQSIEKIDDLTLEASNLQASIEACEARRNLLEDMIIHFEGYESGLIAAMEEKERWPSIAGTVGEKFIPREGLEIALEAALGDLARCLICYDRQTAEEIIDYLKAESLGRIGIMVPDTGTINPAVKRPEMDLPEFMGWLDTFVAVDGDDERLRRLKESVLSHTAVFKAGSHPNELLKHLPYGFSAVSVDGTLYSRNRIYGGSDDGFSLFRRREKVKEQEDLIADLNRKLATVKDEKNRLTAEQASLRQKLAVLSDELQQLGEDIETGKTKINELGFEQRTLGNDVARLEKERQQLQAKLETIHSRQYSLGLDFSQLSGQKDNLMSTITTAGNRLDELELAANKAQAEVSRLQVTLIETKSKIDQLESRLSHIRDLRLEIDNTISSKLEEIENSRKEINLSVEKIAADETSLKETFDILEKHNQRQKYLREVQNEILEKTNSKEKIIKDNRREKDNLSEQIHKMEMKANNIDSEIKSLRDKMLDEYEKDIKTENFSKPEENKSDDEGRELLQQLKERQKNFGAVNLLALEEYRTTKEREEFLSEQMEDLTKAKNDLKATINKINTTARQMFADTFNKVQENFKALFVELFTGGEATIKLTEPDNPLESNIEIIARPRGKKLLPITQMSGGERALTAISLLFSLYLVKPSPFCILDEIDAPLDDANCHRFLKIIKKFSDQTQFIIITHNKITMEAAQNLYGITMEQPGISKLVAVKFLDDDEPDNGNRPRLDNAAEPEEATETTPVPDSIDDELADSIKERITPNITIPDDEEN